MFMATAARACIDRQSRHDAERAMNIAILAVRIDVVKDAHAAVKRGEEGSAWALRQALIDVAACAELMATHMRPPQRPF